MKTQELAENAELYNHELSRRVIGCAIEVHRNLGPGLLVKLFSLVRGYLLMAISEQECNFLGNY